MKKLLMIGLVGLFTLSSQAVVHAEPNQMEEAVAYVNSLPYSFGDLGPAVEAFRVVATTRSWTPEAIDRWTPFLTGVMARESGGCWNLRRGARLADPVGCVLSRQGRATDSGFGQVLMSVHSRWLCPQEGLCSPADVVATPYASMTALVALVERSGRQGWCYTVRLRRGALCRSAP